MSDVNERRTIQAKSCYFAAEIDIAERGNAEQKSTSFRAIARTGDALNHTYWGRVVHDLDGMRVKPRIPVDFNHDVNEVIGYANKFNIESGDLELKGALTPSEFNANDRAREVMDKGEQGVPWQMSINFAGDLEIEEVPKGETVTVNKREFDGPITVIRDWPLRGVAVTPYGYDSGTTTEFASDDVVHYSIRQREPVMAKKTQLSTAEAEVLDVIETTDETDAVEVVTDTTEAKTDEIVDAVDVEPPEETEDDEKVLSLPTGKDFQKKFGKIQGALYFADGLSLEKASDNELDRLQTENAELRNKLAVRPGELEEALELSGGEPDSDSEIWQSFPGAADLTKSGERVHG